MHTQKVATHFKEKNKKKNHHNWLKNKKVIQSQQMPKKLKIFSLKIHKAAGTSKNLKTFLNKGIKRKKNYIVGLNSKNKNIKGGESL